MRGTCPPHASSIVLNDLARGGHDDPFPVALFKRCHTAVVRQDRADADKIHAGLVFDQRTAIGHMQQTEAGSSRERLAGLGLETIGLLTSQGRDSRGDDLVDLSFGIALTAFVVTIDQGKGRNAENITARAFRQIARAFLVGHANPELLLVEEDVPGEEGCTACERYAGEGQNTVNGRNTAFRQDRSQRSHGLVSIEIGHGQPLCRMPCPPAAAFKALARSA